MLRDRTGRIALILLVVFLLIGSWTYYQYWSLIDRVQGEYKPVISSSQPSTDSTKIDTASTDSSKIELAAEADTIKETPPIDWFSEQFNPEGFANPPSKYHPWTKWYWPENEVDRLELIREIDNFKNQGIGGVEIQPLSAGLSPDFNSTTTVLSPAYWHNINLSLRELQKRNMSADLNHGYGWPAGGKYISPEKSMQTLAIGEMHILGGKKIEVAIPKPKMPAAYYLAGWMEEEWKNQMGEWLNFYPDEAKLITLIASKTLDEQRTFISLDLNDYITLDSDSLFLIDKYVNEAGQLSWDAPKGFWKLIAVYQMPTGENTRFGNEGNNLVLNYLDSAIVKENLNHFLAQNKDIKTYLGKGLRGIYHHRTEFLAERITSNDFLTYFDFRNGYDLIPYLPTVMIPGRNNTLMDLWELKRSPEYKITEFDARIRNDYDQALSDLIHAHYFETTSSWTSQNGLINRSQPFGFDFDIIKAAGLTQIPEASQLYAGGSELFTKLISSGANLYNRNLVSAEAMVHPFQGAVNAPWKTKLNVDKLFTSGVNHIVFNGSPYQNVDGKYTELGWSPFQSPYFPFHFSSIINEQTPFFSHHKKLNQYISRCQYLLRQGKSETEVLIFYPFQGFPSSFISQESHNEMLFRGKIPYGDSIQFYQSFQRPSINLPAESDPRIEWLESTWEVINALEDKGLSWSWVNDESIREASVSKNRINIRDNSYQAILLIDIPEIEIQTARHLSDLNNEGGRVYIYGTAPDNHTGFLNHQEYDARVIRYMNEITLPGFLDSPEDLLNLFRGEPFEQEISFSNTYPFLRQIRRSLGNNAGIAFYRNTIDKDRFFELTLSPEFNYCYWFNPLNGEIYQTQPTSRNKLKGYLPAFGSSILVCSQEEIVPDSLIQNMPRIAKGIFPDKELNSRPLNDWDLIVTGNDVANGQVIFSDTSLMDWRDISALSHSSTEGLYTTHLEISEPLNNKRYILDLGTVFEVADIKVNTEKVQSLIFPPFRIDITDYLIPGPNTIEIWVTPALHNRFAGYAKRGNPLYKHYLSDQNQLLPTGLIGPVRLWEVSE